MPNKAYTDKAYKTYQETALTGLSLAQSVAWLLEKSAEHTANMAEAIQKKDIEKRTEESNKACMILNGLKEAIVRVNAEQAITADALERYYDTFQTLILRASIRDDLKSAQAITYNLRRMARFWRDLDSALAAQQSSSAIVPTPPLSDTPPEPVTLGV